MQCNARYKRITSPKWSATWNSLNFVLYSLILSFLMKLAIGQAFWLKLSFCTCNGSCFVFSSSLYILLLCIDICIWTWVVFGNPSPSHTKPRAKDLKLNKGMQKRACLTGRYNSFLLHNQNCRSPKEQIYIHESTYWSCYLCQVLTLKSGALVRIF